jgi:hypothetical protein
MAGRNTDAADGQVAAVDTSGISSGLRVSLKVPCQAMPYAPDEAVADLDAQKIATTAAVVGVAHNAIAPK